MNTKHWGIVLCYSLNYKSRAFSSWQHVANTNRENYCEENFNSFFCSIYKLPFISANHLVLEWSESFNVFFCLLLLLHLCFFFLFLVFLVSRCVSCLPYYYLCCYQFLFPPYFIENTLKLITMIQFGSCAPSHWTVCVCKCVSFVFVTSLLSYNESVHCLHLNRWLGYQW